MESGQKKYIKIKQQNGHKISDHKEILKEQQIFHEKLYSNNLGNKSTNFDIDENIP